MHGEARQPLSLPSRRTNRGNHRDRLFVTFPPGFPSLGQSVSMAIYIYGLEEHVGRPTGGREATETERQR
jgi:hypothetical protein